MSLAYDRSVSKVDGRSTARRRASLKNRFLLALLLSTWIPLIFFVAFSHLGAGNFSFEGIKTVFLFLGAAHVQATLFFYTDKDFSPIIRANRARYIYLPVVLMIGTGLLFVLAGTTAQAFLLLSFWAWQAFHYGRQNVGIYSFVSIAQGNRPEPLEKLAIDLATLCGILGTFKILGLGKAPAYLHNLINSLYWLGFYSFLAVIIFSAIVYLKNFKNATFVKTVFYFTLILFFFPIYLSGDENIAFLSYAVAHGLQYIVFMAVVSLFAGQTETAKLGRYKNMMKLSVFILLVGFVFWRIGAGSLRDLEIIKTNAVLIKSLDFLLGFVIGATMAHFIIDAGAWRLSRNAQRAYMGKRFGFILGAGGAVEPRV